MPNVVGGGAIAMDMVVDLQGVSTYTSSNQTVTGFTLTFAPDNIVINIAGTGLGNYVNGRPTTGTITGYTVVLGGQTETVVTGTNIAAATFSNFLATENTLGFSNAVFGGADSITGTNFNDTLAGYGGADVISGGAGDDTVLVGDISAGESLNGDAGTDTLRIVDGPADVNFGFTAPRFHLAATLASFERVEFATSATSFAIFGANQLGAGLATTATIVGSANQDVIAILMPASGAFNLGTATNFTLQNWTQTGNLSFDDFLAVFGSTGVDTITGSANGDYLNGESDVGAAGNDVILGLGGNDIIDGSGGIDELRGGEGDDQLTGWREEWGGSGEIIDGGNGTDTLDVGGGFGVTINFNLSTITSIEALDLSADPGATGAGLVQFGANQVGGGSALALNLAVNGFAGTTDIVRIIGSGINVNLSGWTFTNWTQVGNAATDDRVLIDGNAAAESLTGTAVGDAIYGNGGDDNIFGLSGNDAIYGGLGADLLDGGSENDSLLGQDGADTLLGGTGDDFLSGAAGHDRLIGDDGGDTLVSEEGNDDLIGGAGADRLIGGAGSDTVNGGGGGDVIDYAFGDGFDTVDGGDGFDTFAITGDAADNILAVTLAGGAPVGAMGCVLTNVESVSANMQGGADWLIYTTSEAVIVDLGGGSASGVASLSNVENVISGSGADTLNGSSADNTLRSGDGADTLLGGAGHDFLFGATGNDRLIGDDGADTLVAEDGNDDLIGGAGADRLMGGTGNDTVNGGDGADELHGEAGADAFAFSTALGAGNVDAIVDFSVADDVIRLDRTVFAAINSGGLDADAFHTGAAAADAEDRIVYNSATGALYYDADGLGAGAAVLFATLASGLALTQDDFFGFGP